MRNKKTYAVFGLGRYGMAVAQELINSGVEVLAVDADENNVNAASQYLPVCKCADVTDMEVLKQLNVKNCDVAVVCMASNLEASVMAITLCKELGVSTVIAKCSTDMHKKIMSKVGADKVVFPEYESGIRLAKSLTNSDFVDTINLAKDISIVDISVKKKWIGKTLRELNLRGRYSMNVIGLKMNGQMSIDLDPTAPLKEDCELVVIAHNSNIEKMLRDDK